jgi:hypothetical protein
LLAVVSLLLAVATEAMWMRSYWVADGYTWGFSFNQQNGISGFSEKTIHLNRGSVYWDSMVIWNRVGPTQLGFSHQPPTPNEGVPATHSGVFPVGNMTGFDQSWRWFGIGFGSRAVSWTSLHLRTQTRFAAAPLWLPETMLLILPVIYFVSSFYRRRHPPGLCRVCGYDLRATPDRCPECGTDVSDVHGVGGETARKRAG